MQQAAEGTGAVTRNMELLAHTVDSTSAAADNVLDASGAMARNTDALRGEIDRFWHGFPLPEPRLWGQPPIISSIMRRAPIRARRSFSSLWNR